MIWWILFCLSATFLTLFLAGVFKMKKQLSVKLSKNSTLQFPDSHILNHRIIVASFVCKGSNNDKKVILL